MDNYKYITVKKKASLFALSTIIMFPIVLISYYFTSTDKDKCLLSFSEMHIFNIIFFVIIILFLFIILVTLLLFCFEKSTKIKVNCIGNDTDFFKWIKQ